MSLSERLRPYLRFAKVAVALSSGACAVAYCLESTRRTVSGVVRPAVLARERKVAPEYIYIDDVDYQNQDAEKKEPAGYFPPWKNLKRSVAWRLLWLCRHGSREQRNAAILQLVAIKNNKEWEYRKLAQALDMETAVLLARTEGADPRYFLPPPIHLRRSALSERYRACRLRALLQELRREAPHACTDYFLAKYFANVQERAVEADTIPSKPDSLSDRQLCLLSLDAAHHHLSAIDGDARSQGGGEVRRRLLEAAAELLHRCAGERDAELAALRVLSALSVHRDLRADFYQNGLLGPLSRWLRSADVRLACSAAGTLANLAAEGPIYRERHLFLLHPLYRTRAPVKCDVLFVHGLRGGVFVTWRQRDPKSESLLGIFGKRQQKSGATAQTDNFDSDSAAADSSGKHTGRRDRSDEDKRKHTSDSSDLHAVSDMENGSDHRQSELKSGHKKETVLMRDSGECKYSTLVGVSDTGYLADPDLRQVMEELEADEEEALLGDYEVVAQDLPESAARDAGGALYTVQRKREALQREQEDCCGYTSCWPKDWLPLDCPDLRIVGVNYCSAVSEWTSGCEGRGALAERAREMRAALRDAGVGGAPLVWLAHSCGGLISESVLTESSQSDTPEERQLAAQTRAIIFYSTPHRGSALATMPRATAALLWPSAIVRELQVDSPMLLRLHRDFLAAAERHGWETISFGESKPTLVSSFKVPLHFVPPESADLGRGPFYTLPLDHLSICKPATRHSLLYTSAVDVLRRITQEPERERRGLLEELWRSWSPAVHLLRLLAKTELSEEGRIRRWWKRTLLEAVSRSAD